MNPARLLALLLTLTIAACSTPPAASAPSIDVTGQPHQPLAPAPGSVQVLLFTTTDCPIANAYAPEIRRICETYERRGVKFFLVHVDEQLTDDAARQHAAEFGYTCPVLIDRSGDLIKATGATVTPEAAVLTEGGRVAYLGRISDLYADFGVKRAAATKHDLRDALDAVLAGRSVASPRVAAVGCTIPR